MDKYNSNTDLIDLEEQRLNGEEEKWKALLQKGHQRAEWELKEIDQKKNWVKTVKEKYRGDKGVLVAYDDIELWQNYKKVTEMIGNSGLKAYERTVFDEKMLLERKEEHYIWYIGWLKKGGYEFIPISAVGSGELETALSKGTYRLASMLIIVFLDGYVVSKEWN